MILVTLYFLLLIQVNQHISSCSYNNIIVTTLLITNFSGAKFYYQMPFVSSYFVLGYRDYIIYRNSPFTQFLPASYEFLFKTLQSLKSFVVFKLKISGDAPIRFI